jgi:acyl carrier protein
MAKSNKAVSLKKDKVSEDVKRLVAQIAMLDVKEVRENANIKDDIGIDSLGAAEILASIEKHLGIVIDEAKAFNVVTVSDLIDLVMFYLKKRRT